MIVTKNIITLKNNSLTLNPILLSFFIALFVLNTKAQNWQELTPVVDNQLRELYTDTVNNILYIGGGFNYIDTTYARGITAYDGTTFYPLGFGIEWDGINSPSSSFPRPVLAITEYDGLLYAGGFFRMAGGIDANGIACWNGTEWDTLNNGVTGINGTGGVVYDLLVHNNELYASGMFDYAGNDTAHSIAKWNGIAWSDVGDFPNYNIGGNTNSIYVMKIYQEELYVGGILKDSLGNPENIARWDGTEWKAVGNGLIGGTSMVYALEVYKDELYVGGNFTIEDGNAGNFIMKWDGNNWTEVGGGVSDLDGYNVPVRHLYVFNEELYAGGSFNVAGGVPAWHIAKWDGTQWCGSGNYINSTVTSISSLNDTLYISGGFWIIDSDTIIRIAKWIGGDYEDTCGIAGNIAEHLSQQDNVNIYPNPTTDNITIDLKDNKYNDLEIVIYDIYGRLVYNDMIMSGNNKINLHLPCLSNGIYILRIKRENIISTHKLIIKR